MQLAELPKALRQYRVLHPAVRGADVMLYQVKVCEPLYDEWPDEGPYYGLSVALSPVGQVKRPKTFDEMFGGLPPRLAEAWVGKCRLFPLNVLLDIIADRVEPEWVFEDERP